MEIENEIKLTERLLQNFAIAKVYKDHVNS